MKKLLFTIALILVASVAFAGPRGFGYYASDGENVNVLNINSSIAIGNVIDDDTMATATDTSLSTSESIKAYHDNNVGSGVVLQQKYNELRTLQATGAHTAMPRDNSIPQDNEGYEIGVLNTTITPASTSNFLEFEISVTFSHPSVTQTQMAIFDNNDGSNDALAAWTFNPQQNTVGETHNARFRMQATAATERDFRVRIGAQDGTTFNINGSIGAQVFGGVASTNFTITEIDGT